MKQHKGESPPRNEKPLRRLLGKLGVRKEQRCPACGASFRCELTMAGCWCADLQLSAGALEFARRRYRDCLCPNCLQALASGEVDLEAS